MPRKKSYLNFTYRVPEGITGGDIIAGIQKLLKDFPREFKNRNQVITAALQKLITDRTVKSIAICLILFSTSVYAQKKSKDTTNVFGGVALSHDTSHYPGAIEVLKDSAGHLYFKTILAPHSQGFFVMQPNLVLIPLPFDLFSNTRIEWLQARIAVWGAEYREQQAKEATEKEKK
jgi:hypothetical protein